MSPYVGMTRKQNGGYNASISVQTLIFHLVVNSTRLKTVRSALWRCPNSTVTLRLLENVVKVTNLEVVKIEFRHLPILLSSFFSQPSALTRAVLKTKHPQIAVKFFEDVPFELSFLAKQQYQSSAFTITICCKLNVRRHLFYCVIECT